jgi:hypothetical protein
MTLRATLAANLSSLCSRERSVAAVCRSTQINRQQFHRYLSGEALPNRHNMQKICRHFGIEEAELFRESEPVDEALDNNAEPWSAVDLRAVLKRMHSELPTSVQPGLYFAHFAHPHDPRSLMRSTVVVRRDRNITTFRRLTGLAESHGSWWSHFTGDHQGVIVERRGWLYFMALNRVASLEPTMLVLKWVPDAAPLLSGHAMILTPIGPTVTAMVLSACPKRTTLLSAVRSSHAYSLGDAAIDNAIVETLDEQCRALVAMVHPLDLSVAPRMPAKFAAQ